MLQPHEQQKLDRIKAQIDAGEYDVPGEEMEADQHLSNLDCYAMNLNESRFQGDGDAPAPFDNQLTGSTLDKAIADVIEKRQRFGRPVFASVDENGDIYYRYCDTFEEATL